MRNSGSNFLCALATAAPPPTAPSKKILNQSSLEVTSSPHPKNVPPTEQNNGATECILDISGPVLIFSCTETD